MVEYLKRFLKLMIGLFFCGTGSYITIQANIGLAPWDSLNMGLSNVTGLMYGNAAVVVGAAIIIIDLLLHEKIGFGTIINAVVYPKWVDIWNHFELIPKQDNFFKGVLLLLLGEFSICVGTWLYMSCAMGSGPRDSLMVGIGKRVKKVPIGAVRGSLEAMAVLGGFLMGAKIGVGTLIAVFAVSFILQAVFTVVHFESRNVVHESIADTLKNIFSRGKTTV